MVHRDTSFLVASKASPSGRRQIGCGRRYGQTDDGQACHVEPFSVEAEVPGGPRAGAHARRLVESELAGRIPETLLADVTLLITELVANGVRHGGAGAESFLHVKLEGSRPGLHVEVSNADHVVGAVARRPPDLDGGGGLGLHLVDALARRWGVRERPRTAVWFEMDC
jgi:anti-sigma regulatory factor (Ser/Thr protein kinase)